MNEALTDVLGVDLEKKESYLENIEENLPEESIVVQTIALSAKDKGLGLRRMDGHLREAAYLGAVNQVVRRLIDSKTATGVTLPGLLPHLEELIVRGSQDSDQFARRMYGLCSSGNSQIGIEIAQSWNKLRAMLEDKTDGPLEQTVDELGTGEHEHKLQNKVSKQIENDLAKKLEERYKHFVAKDRRRLAYENRSNSFASPQPQLKRPS